MNLRIWSTTHGNAGLMHAFTDDGHGHALCNRRIVARWYARSHNEFSTREEIADPVRACGRCTKKLDALVAEAEANRPAADTGDAVQAPAVHHFDSTREAYDATQCRDDIADGDVLVVEDERVVGFLRGAWPGAITEAHGELHTFTADPHTIDDGKYAASVATAEQLARQLELPLLPVRPAAEVVAAADVRAGDTVLGCFPDTVTVETATPAHAIPHADPYTAAPAPYDRTCSCGACKMYAETSEPVVNLAVDTPWDTCDPVPATAPVLIRRAPGNPAEPSTPDAGASEEETAAAREEVAALFAVLSSDGYAHAFQAVQPRGAARPVAWTYRTGYGSATRYGWATAGGGRTSGRDGTEYRWQAERAAVEAARTDTGAAPFAEGLASMSLPELRAALDRLHDTAARTLGTAPKHVLDETVQAALSAPLSGCHLASVARDTNVAAEPGTEEHDPSVHGLILEPRGNGHVTAHWAEHGRNVQPDGNPWRAQLRDIRQRFEDAGWRVVPGGRRAVTAYLPR